MESGPAVTGMVQPAHDVKPGHRSVTLIIVFELLRSWLSEELRNLVGFVSEFRPNLVSKFRFCWRLSGKTAVIDEDLHGRPAAGKLHYCRKFQRVYEGLCLITVSPCICQKPMSERFELGCLNPTTTSLENSLMGISNFRPESHVAQQSRRDKLRVQQSSIPANHLEDLPNRLEQLPVNSGLNPDLIQGRNCNLLYNPTMFSSEMLNFSTNSPVVVAHKEAMVLRDASFASSSHPILSNFNTIAKASNPQNPNYGKNLGSQQSCDWIVNYANGSANTASNQGPPYGGDILPGTVRLNNISASTHYLKPGFGVYQDVQSSLTNPSSEISSQDSQKQYAEMHFSYPSFYQNTLEEVVTSSTNGSHGFEMASLVHQNIRETGQGSWADGGSELVLLPTCGNQSSASRLNNGAAWMHRPVGGSHQLSGELGFVAEKCERDLQTVASDSRAQGLSLSLSSHPPPEIRVAQFVERFGSEDLHSRTDIFGGPQDSKASKSDYLCSNPKSLIGNIDYANSIQGTFGSPMYARQNTGPLGPFTGYATILKSSKFLKPALLLLDEICSVTGSKPVKTCEISERGSGDVSISGDTINAENEVGGKDGNPGASSSTFYSSNEATGEGGVGSGYCESSRPVYQQKKAKLLYMQEEVCRKYKQYHQQMQMVVSSFESVAGLSVASPYTSLALKTVSRHFRFLKNAISDQLLHVSKALGEDLSAPTMGTGSIKDDTTTRKLKFIDQGLRKYKSGEDSLGFLEPQQPVWKPQRGLPERSVSILRAWLFEHFLHPYPTDTDKHMLATQTGLSRNQVSNWFINARVRVWKPMVEEMHMLETKELAEMDLDSANSDGKPTSTSNDQPSNKLIIDAMSCPPGVGSMTNAEDMQCAEQWNQEKRSRMERQLPTSVDGSLMGFVPYQRTGVEVGGLGAVSLTLGLRHSTENAQLQQQQEEENHLRHFGGQMMIHEFVG
ncbi:hypothetical protein HHK36_016636 [Tetracentron sinense]|uniref:Homeobox domain-containing protein n=1 Tax=Tetracentron sinense TaxID=13715 RepID=A0A835DEV4_TETSI|nr:hypothetical protein HHK36_016636 [Tetracentron sinense]